MADDKKPTNTAADLANERQKLKLLQDQLKVQKDLSKLSGQKVKDSKVENVLQKSITENVGKEEDELEKLLKNQKNVTSEFKQQAILSKSMAVGLASMAAGAAKFAKDLALKGLERSWKRAGQAADNYLKSQGAVKALSTETAESARKMEEGFKGLWKQVDSGKLSIKDALVSIQSLAQGTVGTIDSLNEPIFKQWKALNEQAGKLSLTYAQDYEVVRDVQRQAVVALGEVKLETEAVRKKVENVTSAMFYLQQRGIFPVEEGLETVTDLAQEFGDGSVDAGERASDSLLQLARIPEIYADNIHKAEGKVVNFAATNQKLFLKSVMDLNKQFKNQNTSLLTIGSTFAKLADNARKFGASASTAADVTKGLMGLLTDTSKDDVFSVEAGQELSRLLDSKEGIAQITSGMTKDQLANFEKKMLPLYNKLAKAGDALSMAELSQQLGTTSAGIAAKGKAVNKYTLGDLAAGSRQLKEFGLETASPQARLLATQAIQKQDWGELQKIIRSEQSGITTTASRGRKSEAEVTMAQANIIGHPGQAVSNLKAGFEAAVGDKLTEFAVSALDWMSSNPLASILGAGAGGLLLASGPLVTAVKGIGTIGKLATAISGPIVAGIGSLIAGLGAGLVGILAAPFAGAGAAIGMQKYMARSKGVTNAELTGDEAKKFEEKKKKYQQQIDEAEKKQKELSSWHTTAPKGVEKYSTPEFKAWQSAVNAEKEAKYKLIQLTGGKEGEFAYKERLASLSKETRGKEKITPLASPVETQKVVPMNVATATGASTVAPTSIDIASSISRDTSGPVAKALGLTFDGNDAFLQTTITFDQKLPGFKSAVAQIQADILSKQRIG